MRTSSLESLLFVMEKTYEHDKKSEPTHITGSFPKDMVEGLRRNRIIKRK